jgi:hypothetical protein
MYYPRLDRYQGCSLQARRRVGSTPTGTPAVPCKVWCSDWHLLPRQAGVVVACYSANILWTMSARSVTDTSPRLRYHCTVQFIAPSSSSRFTRRRTGSE